MSLPLYILIGSALTLVILTGVFRVEDTSGKIIVLGALRRRFNAALTILIAQVKSWHPYVGRGFVRLVLHYLAHGLLRRILAGIRRVERWIEQLMRQNRLIAKSIDAEKRHNSHLQAIADHKAETALSEREKRRLRSHD